MRKRENILNHQKKSDASNWKRLVHDEPEKISAARGAYNVKKKIELHKEPFYQEANLSFSETEEILLNVWKETLSIDCVSTSDNFFTLGGNGLSALKAITSINKAFNKYLPLSTLFEHPTIETLTDALVNKKILKGQSLVPIKASGSKTPLYIVSYVGGSVDRFCELAYMLDPEQPVYGLQTPYGMDDFQKEDFDAKEVALNYIEKETANYLNEILEQNPEGPYALAGFSYGGFVALEMAKQLQKMGKKVVLLAMLDTLIPGVKKTLPKIPEGTTLRFFERIRHRKAVFLHNFRIRAYDNVFLLRHHPKDWVQIKLRSAKHFFSGAKKTTEIKKQQDPAFKYLMTKRNELTFTAGRNYGLEFYDGEIVLFRARKLSSHSVYNLSLGWKPLVRSIKIHRVDGDHVSMLKPFYCKRFVRLLQRELNSRGKVYSASKT